MFKIGMPAAVRFIIERLALVWSQKYLSLVTKPDQSGSGSSPEVTESGTEDRQKNWAAHFLKTVVIDWNKSFDGITPAKNGVFKDIPKPDQSGSGSSPEATESGAEPC